MKENVEDLKGELERLRLLREDEYTKLGRMLKLLGEERKDKARKIFEKVETLDGNMRVLCYRISQIQFQKNEVI